MKKSNFKIVLDKTTPTIVHYNDKCDPSAFVVDRLYAILAIKENGEVTNCYKYLYFALKKPTISTNFQPFEFEIAAKTKIHHWLVTLGESVVPLENIVMLNLYAKTDAKSFFLAYHPLHNGNTARPFWGLVSNDTQLRILMQQTADQWLNQLINPSENN